MRSKAAPTRRMGVESSETRNQLVEAAGKLLRKEGWAAITARRLVETLGLKRQIVHYYFSTMEDLIIAVIRRESERSRDNLIRALESSEPLRVLAEYSNNYSIPTIIELTALSLRRKIIRSEVRGYMNEIRRIETVAITRYLELRGIKPTTPPVVTAFMVTVVMHTLAVEKALGVTEGHTEMKAVIDGWLRTFAETGQLSKSS